MLIVTVVVVGGSDGAINSRRQIATLIVAISGRACTRAGACQPIVWIVAVNSCVFARELVTVIAAVSQIEKLTSVSDINNLPETVCRIVGQVGGNPVRIGDGCRIAVLIVGEPRRVVQPVSYRCQPTNIIVATLDRVSAARINDPCCMAKQVIRVRDLSTCSST